MNEIMESLEIGESIATVGARRSRREAQRHTERILRLEREITKLRDEIAQLGVYRKLAYIDYLTELRNRRYFEERIRQELSRGRRSGAPCSVVVADIDDFKEINDRHGHAVGDRVLGAVGTMLRDIQREMDTACRIGGDEFAVILPGTGREGAAAFRDRLIDAQPRFLDPDHLPEGLRVRLSFGAATYPDEAKDGHQLFLRADQAMYANKRASKAGDADAA